MSSQNSTKSRMAADDASAPAMPGAPMGGGNDGAKDRHFDTDHLLANLRGRTVSSGFITVTSQGVQLALTLVSTMILARLLTPRDFGLVAMVWTVMSFLRVFKEAGLSTATVQREGITHAQVSNLFWINIAVSGFVSVLVAATAPLVAWFYKEPRLVGVTLALSITFFLAGSAVQHLALLNRQMRFKAIAVIQIGSILAGVLVGVGMAWENYGYWSLVGLNLTTNLVACLMTWPISRWRPQFFKRHSGTRPLFHFGANLTAGAFVYSLARGLDGLLIGRFCGAVSVGMYTRAAALLSRPLEQIMSPIQAVFLPALSRLQTRPDHYRQTFLQLYEAIALTSFLFTGMCFGLARPLTLVLLGPKWEAASAIFACFTFAALQYPLSNCATWLYASQGRGRDSFLDRHYFSHCGHLLHRRSAVRAGRSGVFLFCLLSADPVADSLPRGGPERSGENGGFMDRVFETSAGVGSCNLGWLAGAHSNTGRPAAQGIIDRDSGQPACGSHLHFRLRPIAPGGRQPVCHRAGDEADGSQPDNGTGG